MRVYLSGPMTSRPDWNRPAFAYVAEGLSAQGDTIINPHDLHPEPPPWHPGAGADPGFRESWAQYLREDIAQLVRCDEVVALPGWREDSDGARIEVAVAHLLGIRVVTWPEDKTLPCDHETAMLGVEALLVVADIIGANSASHGGHVEWKSRTPQYHAHKVAGHAVTAAAQLAGEKPVGGGEGAADHLQRCLVRSTLALARMDALERG
jgi:hypothetical protein